MDRIARSLSPFVGVALAVSLAGCVAGDTSHDGTTSGSPKPTTVVTTPAESPSDTASDGSDAQVCTDLDAAFADYSETIGDPATASQQDWIDAYTELAFSASKLAADATPGTDIKASLLGLSSVTAQVADSMTQTGGASTSLWVAYDAALRDAIAVCDLNRVVDKVD